MSERIDPTAKQTTFEKFYHYQPFNRDYLEDTLRNQRLFLSDPHSVNDPWDFKPFFDVRPILEDPDKREAMIGFYRSFLPPETLNDPRRPIFEQRIRTDDNTLRKVLAQSAEILGQELRKRRIYCLTPFPDSTLMWSHYAHNHKGISLEFDKHNALIEKARPVRYREMYPVWVPQGFYDDVLDLVLTKSKDWAYEREFRIIASALDGPTKLDGNCVHLPEGALTSIILGCESPHYEEVSSLVTSLVPTVSIKRMMRVPNEYKLTVVQHTH